MTDKPDPKIIISKEKPCDVCGSSSFRWGLPIAGKEKPGEFMYFRPNDFSWEDGDITLEARECAICGNVKLFTIDS